MPTSPSPSSSPDCGTGVAFSGCFVRFPVAFEAGFRLLVDFRFLLEAVRFFVVVRVAIVMFLPGVEKRANDHADRSTGPRRIPEVAEGRLSRRASIPETGEGFGTLAAVSALRIPARLPGGQRACSLTPLVMLMLLCFLFPGRLHFQPAICAGSS